MQLQELAYTTEVTLFKQAFFDWLNDIVPFDSGIWATRSDIFDLEEVNWVDDTVNYNLPGNFMANYHELASKTKSTDLLNQFLVTNQDQFHTIWDVVPEQEWKQNDYYLKHCAIFGVEQAAAALIAPDNISSTNHAISIFRNSTVKPFSKVEIKCLNLILPVIRMAFKTNLLQSFNYPGNFIISHRLIIDRFGKIIEATEPARRLLERYELMDGTKVALEGLIKITAGEVLSFKVDDLAVRVVLEHGLILMEITMDGVIYELTERQVEICRRIFQGQSYQKITEEMQFKIKTLEAEITKIRKVFKLSSGQHISGFLVKKREFFDRLDVVSGDKNR